MVVVTSSTNVHWYINHCFIHLNLNLSKICRCWIVWGKKIHVVIIPLFLAITYIGQSIYLHLINRFQFITSSYLASVRRCNKKGTRRTFLCSLGDHVDDNGFGRVYGRECPGNGLAGVQDPQGVLGSCGYFGRANIGENKPLGCYSRNIPIQHGAICHPTGSHCDFEPDRSSGREAISTHANCFGVSH